MLKFDDNNKHFSITEQFLNSFWKGLNSRVGLFLLGGVFFVFILFPEIREIRFNLQQLVGVSRDIRTVNEQQTKTYYLIMGLKDDVSRNCHK